ncbi:MAG TPA: T9SS type A sorting domain-containing protein, partial [Tenuifilaceae bacterium]|nr:T9SS type A sorting domain-containing protein [Tenuifilaceae bacterium]
CSSNLSVQAPTKYSRVTVTDLIGRVVMDMQHDFGQTLNLNTQSIPKGIYLVTLMSHNGQKTVTRVVRQ